VPYHPATMRPHFPLLLLSMAALGVTPLACKKKPEPQPSPSSAPSASGAPAGSTTRPAQVSIRRELPGRGSSRHDSITRQLRFEAATPQGKPLVIEEHVERDVKVLAVRDNVVSKIEVKYGKVASSTTDGDAPPQTTNDPRSDRSFVLSQEVGRLTVTDSEGSAAPQAIADSITADHVSLGLPFPLPSVLPDAPIAPGDDFDLSHDVVLALFPIDADGDFDVTHVRLVFERVSPAKRLQFGLKTRFWGVHAGRRIELDVKGTLVARAPDAWPERLSLEGPAKLLAKANDNPAAARPGHAKIEVVSTYGSSQVHP
jgi:hypothetical protein